MRLWSLHPCYLDAKGLLGLWRESLLAQKVLQGHTKGYRHHPQLLRFKHCEDPLGAIACYLGGVVAEADRRGYCFDKSKIVAKPYGEHLTVTHGQVMYELGHLSGKLQNRDPSAYARLSGLSRARLHPLFDEIAGGVEPWEIV